MRDHLIYAFVITGVMLEVGAAEGQERVPLPAPNGAVGTTANAPEETLPPPMPNIPEPAAPSQPPPPTSPYSSPAPYPPPYPPPGGYPGYPPYPPPPPLYARPMRDPNDPSFWIGADALLWWMKSQPLSPPVLTTGPTSQGLSAGALGAPGTTSLTQPLDFSVAGGARIFAGGWFDMGHTIGMDGSLFILGQQRSRFGASDPSGTGQFVINEPVAGAPFITQVSGFASGAPNQTGNANVTATSQFGGGDVNLLFNVLRSNGWTVNLLGGFRYLQVNESLTITGNSTEFMTTNFFDNFGNLLVSAPPGSGITMIDSFTTRNEFYGGQLGAQVQYPLGRWSIGALGKFAIGGTHEVINVNGTTNVFPAGGSPTSLTGGNFATAQIGRYINNRFAFAPELQLNLGYDFTPWMRGVVGYDFFYLSSIARPGNQIDNTFDGVNHPAVPMASSSFWAQGLNLGLHFRY